MHPESFSQTFLHPYLFFCRLYVDDPPAFIVISNQVINLIANISGDLRSCWKISLKILFLAYFFRNTDRDMQANANLDYIHRGVILKGDLYGASRAPYRKFFEYLKTFVKVVSYRVSLKCQTSQTYSIPSFVKNWHMAHRVFLSSRNNTGYCAEKSVKSTAARAFLVTADEMAGEDSRRHAAGDLKGRRVPLWRNFTRNLYRPHARRDVVSLRPIYHTCVCTAHIFVCNSIIPAGIAREKRRRISKTYFA